MDRDTPALERYTALLRAQSSAEKARTWVALCSGTRRLALAGLKARHPELGDEELMDRLAGFLYGPRIEQARRAWRERARTRGG